MRPLALLLAALFAGHAFADYPKDPIAAALKASGKNRPEIQKVLDHYRDDPQKLAAAKFLIENMIGKAYKVVTSVDKHGKDVGFDALKYKSLDEGLHAIDELEKKYGPLEDKVTPHYDLERLPASFLIEHIDLAFKAWRELPWAKDVTWETFRDYVLPYRSGKEPAEAWRAELMERYAWVPGKMKDPSDLREAASLIGDDASNWVGFWDLYYIHPTEQGFSEMKKSLKGRCGDLSNFSNTVLRAMAIPCTIDYTPYWADTGNNHAWPLALSATGIASDSSIHKAAKIYRKTFANHAENLMYHQAKGEVLPPWLNRPDYVDVTKQYLPTSDVTVSSKVKAPHAYLCVFNDGEWRPIQWARVVDKVATFAAMGRDILYLPVAFGKSGIVPAADPFILLKDGAIRSIVGSTCFPASYELTEKGGSVHAGKSYELFVWDSGWKSLGKQSARDDRVVKFTSVPSGYLYWLVEEGSRKEERPFTIDDGKQVWW